MKNWIPAFAEMTIEKCINVAPLLSHKWFGQANNPHRESQLKSVLGLILGTI
ncbi:MAG: hypothetical protein R3D86_10940 [Emcibacteraceae bacterium]